MKEDLKIIYYQSLVCGYALMQYNNIDNTNKDEVYI